MTNGAEASGVGPSGEPSSRHPTSTHNARHADNRQRRSVLRLDRRGNKVIKQSVTGDQSRLPEPSVQSGLGCGLSARPCQRVARGGQALAALAARKAYYGPACNREGSSSARHSNRTAGSRFPRQLMRFSVLAHVVPRRV